VISKVIGYSIENRPIEAYQFGGGPDHRALVGGIHGGYEWNTVHLMWKMIAHLRCHPDWIPPQIMLHIIPNMNPDGYARSSEVLLGRPNAGGVDLNRNWDYHWGKTATHGKRPVYAGEGALSEPETQAVRKYLLEIWRVTAAVFYHSAYASVFQGAGVDASGTAHLARVMARATRYRYRPEGVPGQITTGDAIDDLSTRGVAAVEVELTTHQGLDWNQNREGLKAFLEWNAPDPPAVEEAPADSP
jgi:hypothetical protein